MKCSRCGKQLEVFNEYMRNFCDECLIEKKKEHDDKVLQYLQLKNELALERAITRFEEHRDGIHKFNEYYKPAIEAVNEFMKENPETLASTEEIITAIALIAEEIHIKCQYKIGKYRVDFLLPELKAVLEIDGYYHKGAELKDTKRDLKILSMLGEGWEIIRIPTEWVNRAPCQLVDIIFNEYHRKREYRKYIGGLNLEREKILTIKGY
jgi:very-short-patch-repair endonuclease